MFLCGRQQTVSNDRDYHGSTAHGGGSSFTRCEEAELAKLLNYSATKLAALTVRYKKKVTLNYLLLILISHSLVINGRYGQVQASYICMYRYIDMYYRKTVLTIGIRRIEERYTRYVRIAC